MDKYLDSVKNKLLNNFDISENGSDFSLSYDFYAKYNVKSTRYAVVKEVEIYNFENNEHFFVNSDQTVDAEYVKNEISVIKENLKEIVRPHGDHMSSQIMLIHVFEDKIPKEIEKTARRLKYQKGFSFGFKGWADLALVVISLKENRVITHKKIMKTASFLTPDEAV